LWASRKPVSFNGRFVRFNDMTLACPPHSKAGPAIYVGGNTPGPLRRAGALGDGWLGMEVYVDEVAEAREQIHRAAKDAGRDPASIVLSVRRGVVPPFEVADFLPERRSLRGSTREVADELLRYRDEGVTLAVLDLAMLPAEAVRTIEWLASDVVPLLA
jgi:alkanesulfonate monooxygenase SsuD/methylene tetrahydromethanopterin reductase-like flavin-dependent oxidoreductase (luciferase family)